MHWFVQVRLGQSQPVDISRLLAELGFADSETFLCEALREYLFLKFRSSVARQEA